MTNINAFAFTLSVNIFQLCVNIIMGSVYKMVDWLLVSVLVLVGCIGVLSYKLGYRIGSVHTWKQARNIFQDTAQIVEDNLWTTWKP